MPEIMVPLVGRDSELEELLSDLGRIIGGNGHLVLVAGEAGIGKTRLCEEFERRAARTGCRLMIGRCIPGIPCPYLPFSEAIEGYFGSGSCRGQDLQRTIGEVAEGRPVRGIERLAGRYTSGVRPSEQIRRQEADSDRQVDSDRILFSTLEFLRESSAEAPVVFRLEDLHWADSASIQLLHFLARNIKDLRVLMLGTYRPEDVVQGEGEPHPLNDALRIMRREGTCHEMHLSPLNPGDMARAVEGMLGSPLDSDTMSSVIKECQGNPLFAIETARLLVETGSIKLVRNRWVSQKDRIMKLPATVKEVQLRRIERLPRSDRKILDCASVVGEVFDPAVVERVLSINRLDLLESLEAMERNYQVLQSLDGGFRFSHETMRRINYEMMSQARRKELHRRIGLTLEEVAVLPCDYGQMSHHFYHGGVADRCVRYSLLAGDACVKKCSPREAVDYFGRVLECCPEGEVATRLAANEGIGDAYNEMGDYESAFQYYDGVLGIVETGKERGRVLRKCADCWAPQKLGKGTTEKHGRFLAEAEMCEDLYMMDMAELLSAKSLQAVWTGRFEEAGSLSKQAQALFREIGANERLAYEVMRNGFVDLSQGKPDDALLNLKDALKVFSKHPWPRGEMYTNGHLGEVYMLVGDVERAMAAFDIWADTSRKLGDYHETSWSFFYRGLLCFIDGNLGEAREALSKSRDYAEMVEYRALMALPDALLTAVMIDTGDLRSAEKHCAEAQEFAGPPDVRLSSPLWGLVEVARAEMEIARGNESEGNARYEQGVQYMTRSQLGKFYEAVLRMRFCEHLRKQGDVHKAEQQLIIADVLLKELGNIPLKKRVETRMAALK